MKQQTHTPGPWTWDIGDIGKYEYIDGQLPRLYSGETIILGLGYGAFDGEACSGEVPNDPDMALIAEAPRLLAALKKLCDTPHECACCGYSEEELEVWNEAREAIKSAEPQ